MTEIIPKLEAVSPVPASIPSAWRTPSAQISLLYERLGQDFDGEAHLTEDEVLELIGCLEGLESALRRIAEMTDIETDFDGFEARQIAQNALAGDAQ